ncbi:MAG: response regulator, partial [Proteobacteria bacterium]|nr:response regulator [Pseudomonadota bacterium]
MSRILIIEDNKDLAFGLRSNLEIEGYEVIAANTGREGISQAKSFSPDLVILDLMLPEMDGFELLGAINQRLKDEVIPPFLFLTAKVEKQDIRHGMSLGADDYILKPFNHTEVLDIIRMRLDKREKLLHQGEDGATKAVVNAFDKLALPCEDGLELVAFENIVRCEADRAYCTFYLIDGRKILVSKPLKEFENILVSKHFLRIHKSTIINIKFADKYIRGKGGYLLLSDGSHVNVSARRKEELMKILKSLATNYGLALLSHELGHIIHDHSKKNISVIEAQVEADLFAAKLGFADELENFLLDQPESTEKRV